MNPKPGPNPLRSPTRTPLSLPCRQPTPPISPNRPGPGRFLSRKVQRLAPGPLRHSPARPAPTPRSLRPHLPAHPATHATPSSPTRRPACQPPLPRLSSASPARSARPARAHCHAGPTCQIRLPPTRNRSRDPRLGSRRPSKPGTHAQVGRRPISSAPADPLLPYPFQRRHPSPS